MPFQIALMLGSIHRFSMSSAARCLERMWVGAHAPGVFNAAVEPERTLNARLRVGAAELGGNLPGVVEHQMRDSSNAGAVGQAGVLVHVDPGHPQRIWVLASELLDHRCEHPARRAPRRPIV